MAFTYCEKPKDLSGDIDFSSEVGPIKDQDSIGWCYAYTAADLLNQYLYKNKNTKHGSDATQTVSPVSIALLYNQFGNKPSYHCQTDVPNVSSSLLKNYQETHSFDKGGAICDALMVAITKKVCLEGQMRSGDFSYVETPRCNLKNGCRLDKLLNQLTDKSSESFSCADHEAIKLLLPGIKEDTVWQILDQANRNDILDKLRNINCKFSVKQSHTPLPQLYNVDLDSTSFDFKKGRYILENKNENLFKILNTKLAEGKAVSISYFSNFLVSKKSKHKKNPSKHIRNSEEEVPGLHASTVVGARFNKINCELEYKIKNSWGTGCKHYTTDSNVANQACVSEANQKSFKEDMSQECAMMVGEVNGKIPKKCIKFFSSEKERENNILKCDKDFPIKMNNPKLTCEVPGYVFIPKSELEKNLFNISYLDY